ncbi:MAG: sugar transferase [Syntrophales bacterium]
MSVNKSKIMRGFIEKTSRTNGFKSHFSDENQFRYMLRLERKRTERSNIPFVLMLIDLEELIGNDRLGQINKVKSIVTSCLRETDITGWYSQNKVIGVIFTGAMNVDQNLTNKILQKLQAEFHDNNSGHIFGKIKISFHHYPEDLNGDAGDIFNDNFYPDLSSRTISKKIPIIIKRCIDIILSLLFIILTAPLFLTVSLIIKLTSPGPVFFKQRRMGLNGRQFIFLKFRTMYVNTDSQRHQQYVKQLISGGENSAVEPGVYKIKEDPRITPFGSFLRKTSIDEIPQFLNVLRGDMSLIGPRPPIPYEFAIYDIWHRRRLLSCKPGITGLWQVNGRSATTFDEMVRLDLEYIENWSLWRDIRILFKTPYAVLSGRGAY